MGAKTTSVLVRASIFLRVSPAPQLLSPAAGDLPPESSWHLPSLFSLIPSGSSSPHFSKPPVDSRGLCVMLVPLLHFPRGDQNSLTVTKLSLRYCTFKRMSCQTIKVDSMLHFCLFVFILILLFPKGNHNNSSSCTVLCCQTDTAFLLILYSEIKTKGTLRTHLCNINLAFLGI